MVKSLTKWLQHPLTVGLNVDSPETTLRRREIIRSKAFLKRLYCEWYDMIRNHLPSGEGDVIELGSGAGFMKEAIPDVITTEVLDVEGIDVSLSADGILPFKDGTLRSIVMTDVLHHIGSPRSFLREASRTVRTDGAIIMVEPWVTQWSRIVYDKLHPEPFRPAATEWEFPSNGPLSGANGALPWILFDRDRATFEREFPEWRISLIEPMMPFSYLISGGVSMRALCPGWMYNVCRAGEKVFRCIGCRAAMFALIKLERI